MYHASPFTRLARLSIPERRAALSALVGLSALVVLLPLLGPSRLLKALPRASTGRAQPLPAARIVGLVASTASWMPWRPTCLHRSLVSAWLLGRSGFAYTVVLGLRRPGERPFDAHAWIEVDGVPTELVPAGSWTTILRWPMTPAAR